MTSILQKADFKKNMQYEVERNNERYFPGVKNVYLSDEGKFTASKLYLDKVVGQKDFKIWTPETLNPFHYNNLGKVDKTARQFELNDICLSGIGFMSRQINEELINSYEEQYLPSKDVEALFSKISDYYEGLEKKFTIH